MPAAPMYCSQPTTARAMTPVRAGPCAGSKTACVLALVSRSCRGSGNTTDLGAQRTEFFLDVLVAAIEMVDAVDDGVALGDQARQDQRSRGAQVGRHHRRAAELFDATDDGGVAIDLDVGAQAQQFVDVHEAVLEDRLADHAHAVGDAVHGHELGLHVGRECRIRRGGQADRARTLAMHVQGDAVGGGLDRSTGFGQLVQHRLEGVATRAARDDPAAGHRRGHQEGAGLDPVRQHRMASTGQPLHAVDHDARGACALDIRAQRDQAIGQVGDFRFHGRVLEHGGALGQGRGHQHVLGAGHADHVEYVARAFQSLCSGLDEAVLDRYFRPQRLQALDVLVDRARADRATARQRDFRRAVLGQQRAQHQDRGAHGLDQFVGRHMLVDAARIDGDRTAPGQRAFVDADARAQFAQQLHRGDHVVQVRHVGDFHRRIGQQGGAQDRQHRVLGAGDGDFAVEGIAAGDYDFLHGLV